MYRKILEKQYLIYIKFALILLLAYFPLWSFVMSIKNDALTLSYPPFYFFSSQLAGGHIPWWHFNLHLGFPLHADPGFPFWSPITWLWSVFGPGLHSYTLLIFFYVFISGVGMIKLSKWMGFEEPVQLLLGISFPVSGFFSAHLQHPHYIFEAAFIPFVLLYFLKVVSRPQARNTICLSISIFFLVNSGYPSFTISAVYFFILLLAGILITQRVQKPGKIFYMLLLSVLIAVILCLPYIYSLYQFYPYYNRSGSLEENYIYSGGLSPRSFLSILFPIASVSDASFFRTDRAWSNIYIGLLPLLFIIYSIRNTDNKLKIPLFVAGIFMLLASLQGAIKGVFYSILPFYNRMHSNGGLRIYFILSMLILAGIGLDKFFKLPDIKKLRAILFSFLIIFILAGIITFFIPGSNSIKLNSGAIKNIPFKNAVLLESIGGLIILLVLFTTLKNKKLFLAIGLAEIILAFIINLPFTGLGTNNTKYVQQHLDSIIRTRNLANNTDLLINSSRDRFINDPALFSNHLAITNTVSYPSGLTNYFSNINELKKIKRPVFSANNATVHDFNISGDDISFAINTAYDNDTVTIAQNFYPNWKYYANETSITPFLMKGTFTGLALNKGSFTIKGFYRPLGAIICFVISIFAWIAISIFLTKKDKTVNVYRNS